MIIVLENEVMKAEIDTFGAELIHFIKKETGYDYMWSGDDRYWSGRSPVLFPVIGGLTDGVARVDGKSYAMKNHGFARKSDFQCLDHNQRDARFKLSATQETMTQYPYAFDLELVYTLDEMEITIDYVISNRDTKTMPFQIGTHPAFNCPFGATESLDEWLIEFEEEETLERIGLKDNLIDLGDVKPVMEHTRVLPLKADMFYSGAIVFRDVKSKSLVLKSSGHDEGIKVSYDHLPDMGIWQPEDAPFLCIEPWYGHGDFCDFKGDLMEKERMIHLEVGDVYQAQLEIAITKV